MPILATLLALVAPTCPSWCVLPADQHGGPGSIDHASGDTFVGHERPIAAGIGGWSVDLIRDDVQPASGSTEIGDPAVILNGDTERPLSLAEARELAAALLRAADTADGHRPGIGRHAVDAPTMIMAVVPRSAA